MTRSQFDQRYAVQNTNGQWHVADTQERKMEAGPFRERYRADQVLAFMRQHCED